jgi:endonuclease/exonuclease/phosphatase family metal-dependent hydrolase
MRFPWLRLIEATAVLLFTLQAVRALFSTLFGVIYDAVFARPFTPVVALIGLLMLLAFLAPLAAPRDTDRVRLALLAAVAVAAVARAPMTVNHHTVRLYSSIVVVAAGGVYLAALLRHAPGHLVRAIVLALIADQLLRALGNTWDVTMRPAWLVPQTLLSAGLILLARYLSRPEMAYYEIGRTTGVRLGLLGALAWAGLLFIETSLLSLPNALARWSEASYAILTPLLLGATLLAVMPGLREAVVRAFGGDAIHARLWGLALVLIALIGIAVGRQAPGAPAAIGLLAAQAALLLALPHLLLPRADGAPERIGLWLAVGGLVFLILNFAYAFAFTYSYTLAAFKGMGLPTVLVAALLATLPALLRPISAAGAAKVDSTSWVTWTVAALALVTVAAAAARPHSVEPPLAGNAIRAGTYNVHYGYDKPWHHTLEEEARTIEASGTDVVALQEVDTGRLTSYGVDDALWLSRRLSMEVVYLPTVERLTGIALLSRFPIEASQARLLTSQLEPTGIIRARLQVGDRTLDAYAIWLGLRPEERAAQLTDALAFIAEADADTPAVWGGDFNSTPDSPIHARIAAAGFVDPFVELGLEPAPTDPADDPQKRIDFLWLRGLAPVDGEVLDSQASDHRMVVVEGRLGR